MYPGGKNTSYHKIINLMPPHDTYIELFLGSGAIMRNKRPAALNIGIELNPLVLHETAATIAPGAIIISGDGRRHPSSNPAITAALEAHAKNGDGAASSKLAIAATLAKNGGVVELATNDEADITHDVRLVNNSDTSGAIARNNDTDGHSVSIVKNSDGISWQFLCIDALRFLNTYPFTGREFIYADPPYLMSTRRSQRQLYLYELGEQEQHIALLTRLKQLPCYVAISGYASDLYNDLLAGWHTYTFRARTRGGPMATEWLWMNYPPPTALHDYQYLGDNFRQREAIKRQKQRWLDRLRRMPTLKRQALLWAIQEAELSPAPPAENDDALAGASPETASPAGHVRNNEAGHPPCQNPPPRYNDVGSPP